MLEPIPVVIELGYTLDSSSVLAVSQDIELDYLGKGFHSQSASCLFLLACLFVLFGNFFIWLLSFVTIYLAQTHFT